jgi:hypothetical protein
VAQFQQKSWRVAYVRYLYEYGWEEFEQIPRIELRDIVRRGVSRHRRVVS